MVRDKERIKEKIVEILSDNKPEILPLKEIEEQMQIEKAEKDDFRKAVKELESEGKIRIHIAIS